MSTLLMCDTAESAQRELLRVGNFCVLNSGTIDGPFNWIFCVRGRGIVCRLKGISVDLVGM